MKILIIDDNVQLTELTRIALVKNDYEVAICNVASEGVDYVRLHHPDLILIDIIMPPDLSGLEIAKSLKADQELKDIPIVFITGLMVGDEDSLQEQGLNVDGIKYPILGKPYKSEQLLSMVRKYVLQPGNDPKLI